jgi:hypothetical protein
MGFPGAGGVQLIKELEYVLINHVGHQLPFFSFFFLSAVLLCVEHWL